MKKLRHKYEVTFWPNNKEIIIFEGVKFEDPKEAYSFLRKECQVKSTKYKNLLFNTTFIICMRKMRVKG